MLERSSTEARSDCWDAEPFECSGAEARSDGGVTLLADGGVTFDGAAGALGASSNCKCLLLMLAPRQRATIMST